VAQVQFSDGYWHTVLISAEGNGGDRIFALDISNDPSDPTRLSNPTILWEYGDTDLFRSRSAPSVGSIGRVASGGSAKWVVFFVSGINEDETAYPALYMVDIESDGSGNPAKVEKIILDSAAGGIGGTPSGQPGLIDSDGNGLVDRLYIGTDKGYMYKVSLPDNPDQISGSINECVLKDAGQPIQASPAAVSKTEIGADGELDYRVIVLFGTGDSPSQSDDSSDPYFFYAVEDTDVKGSCSAGTDLWSVTLPAGHRIFASAFATADTAYFGTTAAETDDRGRNVGHDIRYRY
jgi:Tfp pilus tip-associated adhesin PilY1